MAHRRNLSKSHSRHSSWATEDYSWTPSLYQEIADMLYNDLQQLPQLKSEEEEIYKLQDEITMLNENRHVRKREARNLDRKINFVVQCRALRDQKEAITEDNFLFFDQSASQDNPLGLKKSDYSSFLFLLRTEPRLLGKFLVKLSFGEMDYTIQTLTFSLFPDLFQAREEMLLLDLIRCVIEEQAAVELEATDILRQNSFVTKLIHGYAKRHYAKVHLVLCLKDVITEFMNVCQQTKIVEVKPDLVFKALSGEQPPMMTADQIMAIPDVQEVVHRSKDVLLKYVRKLIESLIEHLPSMPFGLRYISRVLVDVTEQRFKLTEKQYYTLVSSFVILRYVNPAILAADVNGLIDHELDMNSRRPLILLTKLLQSYANEIMFGVKEDYMMILNEGANDNIELLKGYCEQLVDVPDPQDYYATVTTLPHRKNAAVYFLHSTTISICPNELFAIHRMVDKNQKLIPENHPLMFFLKALGGVPEKVGPAEDKVFTISLSTINEPTGDTNQREHDVREICQLFGEIMHKLQPPQVVLRTNDDFFEWLANPPADIADEVKAIIQKMKSITPDGTAIVWIREIDRYANHRVAYKASIQNEMAEMKKSAQMLKDQSTTSDDEVVMYQNYLKNILRNAFLVKLHQKKEWKLAGKVGPLEINYATLEKHRCFADSNIDAATKKTALFSFCAIEAGNVELVIKVDKVEQTKVNLIVVNLLDLLTTQDLAKIGQFSWDLRALLTFLMTELF